MIKKGDVVTSEGVVGVVDYVNDLYCFIISPQGDTYIANNRNVVVLSELDQKIIKCMGVTWNENL